MDSPGKSSVDLLTERQSNSLKCRYNPPETIPEEEIERIRRESLIPRVGLLAGAGRRKSSIAVESALNGISCAATVTTTTSFVTSAPGVRTLASTMAVAARTATAFISGSPNSGAGVEKLMRSPQIQQYGGLDIRDEGVGEPFDKYSELSESHSRTGVAGSIIELQTFHTKSRDSPTNRHKAVACNVVTSSNNNRIIKDATDDEFDGMTFTAPPLLEDCESDSQGVDPLSFLSEAQARRVTFM